MPRSGKLIHLQNDLARKEELLRNRCQRELDNGQLKSPICQLRLKCMAKGVKGITDLSRAFRRMNLTMDQKITQNDFKQAIIESGLSCDSAEISKVFNSLDENKNGIVDMSEVFQKIRPQINANRLKVIDLIFNKLDMNGEGQISIEKLRNKYTAKYHPQFLSGELTEDEIITDFISYFENNSSDFSKRKDYLVSKEDFINYYSMLSASIDKDAYFDLLLRNAYKL